MLRRAAGAGAPAGTVAVADFQSAGRGRLGRSWAAPPGTALLLSVLLRPARGGEPAAAGALPLRVGLATVRALRQAAAVTATLKWPNDVLAGERKLAGILCEAAGDFVVVGIGVNLSQSADQFANELRALATSVRLVTGRDCGRAALAGAILRELAPLFVAPHRPLHPAELDQLSAVDALAGRTILLDDVPAGTAAGINPQGALLVCGPAGTRPCFAGSVRRAP